MQERDYKLWQVSEGDSVFAKTEEEALEFYLKECGIEPEDAFFLEEIYEVDDDHKYFDEELEETKTVKDLFEELGEITEPMFGLISYN